MTKPQRIQRRRSKGWKMPPGAISCTRPGPWGNPFTPNNIGVMLHAISMGLDGEDEHDLKVAAVDVYRLWVTGDKVSEIAFAFLPTPKIRRPKPKEIQRELRGRDLACWCAIGQPCHATVLLEIANQ